ncbi:MAG: suppressor of fused domain protein [Planctomycetes bacterium]|nr:suppressor of fused domain protein [Planctomycetota bacterium]
MTPVELRHQELTEHRIRAYLRLFGVNPSPIYSSLRFSDEAAAHPIDVFVFTLDAEVPIVAAVTNGMSDHRLVDPAQPEVWIRRELIQYFPVCTELHAKRLHDMAWLPLVEHTILDSHYSLEWQDAALRGTPFKNALFLDPIVPPHRDFRFSIDGDPVSLLWHVPITDKERAFIQEQGTNALLERMAERQLPWIFDEMNRPLLVD